MFRVILLICFVTLVLCGHLEKYANLSACVRFSNRSGINCAKSNYTRTATFGIGLLPAKFKDCYPPKGKMQHFFTCVAYKKGYLFANGTVDRKTLEDILKKDFESNPELAHRIIEKCVNADLSNIYEKTMYKKVSYILKIHFCVEFQSFKDMVWDNEGDCYGIKALFEECASESGFLMDHERRE